MKPAKILDVDYIGGQDGLTKDEEFALSEFFGKRRSVVVKNQTKRASRKSKEKA